MCRFLFAIFMCVFYVTSSHAQKRPYFDTTIHLFTDTNYVARFVIDNEDGQYDDDDRKNAAFMLFKGKRLMYHDSLSVTGPDGGDLVQSIDYSGDGIRDLVLFHLSDVRSNHQFYLYIVDTASHSVHRVRGFEEIKSASGAPSYDSVNNIIGSYVMSGTDYMKFYKIKPNFTAVDCGYTVYDDHIHDKRVDRQLQKIYKKEGWKLQP